MDSCSVCLELINENAKTLVCGHTFHLECILNWFVTSELCPMCRACQKDDPLIKFKNKLVCIDDDEEEDDAESQYNHFKECLRCILLRDPYDLQYSTNFEQSLRRAMIYEMTMEDMEGPLRTDAQKMIEYQDTYRCQVAIIYNWRCVPSDRRSL